MWVNTFYTNNCDAVPCRKIMERSLYVRCYPYAVVTRKNSLCERHVAGKPFFFNSRENLFICEDEGVISRRNRWTTLCRTRHDVACRYYNVRITPDTNGPVYLHIPELSSSIESFRIV
jgi:hypothetical protein